MGCYVVRLAGCKLRCGYCDTPGALEAAGNPVAVADIVRDVRQSRVPLAEITGGEPLMQPGFTSLAEKLISESGKKVLVETNGSLDIGMIPEKAVAIVDVKCPGSGAGSSFDLRNIEKLRNYDELKFVLSGEDDYIWAHEFVQKYGLVERVSAVHFSPVAGAMDAAEIGRRIVEDGLSVRLQVQLHRVLGMA
jgi:7-carboxy-7-deazaguanine synthase